jgi:hypothetical protein
VFRVERLRGPIWYAKYRLPDGRQGLTVAAATRDTGGMSSWRSVCLGSVGVLCGAAVAVAPAVAASGPVVFSGAGAQQVAGAIAGFEAAIGGADNGTAPGPRVGGFRTLNWDDVAPGTYSARSSVSAQGVEPSGLDGLNFVAGSSRGLEMATAGTGVEVSRDGFRELNPTYPALLASPSGPNAFGSLGSTETDVTFEVPDNHTSPWNTDPPGTASGDLPGVRATVSGLGAVFMNVEAAGTSSIEYLAADGRSLGTYFVPTGPAGAPEFVGVRFDGAPVAAVHLVSGTVPLSAGVTDDGGPDNVVALGDLATSEPVWGPGLTINPDVVKPGPPVTITGTAHDPIGTPSVTVAGTPATVSPDGSWTATVPGVDLPSEVTATATDGRGLTATAVQYLIEAPVTGSGPPVSLSCHVALSPPAITVTGLAPKRHRTGSDTGHLAVRATCDLPLRGVVTVALTAISRSTTHHRRIALARTFVLRSRPMTVAAGRGAKETLAVPHQLAVQLVDKHPRVTVRLTLRAVGAVHAAAAASGNNVRVVRQRPHHQAARARRR